VANKERARWGAPETVCSYWREDVWGRDSRPWLAFPDGGLWLRSTSLSR